MAEIQVIFDNGFIQDSSLDFVDDKNLGEIKARMEKGESVACGFFKDQKLLFCAVLDFVDDCCVHVNAVGGNFGRYYPVLESVVTGLAKFLNYDFISLTTKKRAVKKWALKSGFYYHEDANEYMKVVA